MIFLKYFEKDGLVELTNKERILLDLPGLNEINKQG
jgi:hypothetical protein